MSTITPALAETLSVFDGVREPLSTSEVCDGLDVGRRSTYERLDRLSDAGRLRTKAVGSSGRVWWLPRDREPTVDSASTAASGPSGDDDVDASLRAALDAAPVGVATFDTDGTLAFASSTFAAHLGVSGEVTTEALASVDLAEGDDEPVADPVETLFTTGDQGPPARRRVRVEDGGTWLAVAARTTDDDRVVATTRDVTTQVDWEFEMTNAYAAAERELDEFRTRAVDAFASVDAEGRVVDVDGRFAACFDTTNESLLGRRVDEALAAVPAARDVVHESLERDVRASSDEAVTVGGRSLAVEAVPVEHGCSVYVRDVTDRIERERAHERYASLVDALGQPVYELDADGEFRFVNDAAVEASGYSREQLLGSHVSLGMTQDAVDAVSGRLAESVAAGGDDRLSVEFEVEPKDGDPYPVENRLAILTDGSDEVTGTAGILRDVSDRRERERELERYERIVETVDDGIYVLDDDDRFALVNDAFAAMVDESAAALVGAAACDVLDDSFVAQAKRCVASDGGAVGADGDVQGGSRFQEAVHLASGGSFVANVQVSSFGPDADETGHVAVVRDVTERVNRERKIANQRARLEALNEVNALVRDVASAAVEGSTREAIETLVCEALAEASSYSFAWVGEVDPHDGTVSLRTEAGVEDYLSGVTITTDPADDRSHGPVGRAVRDRTVETVQDAAADPRYAPFRDLVDEHGFRSAAVIPITYDGTLYGVLSVHADRRNAFREEERAVIERIGEFVGHAFAAVERKRALESEEVVTLDYRLGNVFEDLDVDVRPEGRIAFEETVHVDSDELLVYGSVTEGCVPELRALVSAFDAWQSISVTDSPVDGGEHGFELRTAHPPAFAQATANGGYVERATIEDGESRVRIRIPPEVDVRTMTEAVETAYPGSELVAKRQTSRSTMSMTGLQGAVADVLTDRQRTALEAAFHAGFFDWPRRVTGSEVAASLEVAPPTFSQHMRKAERKVFELLLGGDAVLADASTESDPE